MYKELNIKKIIILCYIIIPFFFYSIPYVFSLQTGYIRLHFFETFNVPSSFFLICIIGYLCLGLGVFISLSKTHFKIKYIISNDPLINWAIIILFSAQLFIPIGYIKVFFTPLFTLFIATHRPKNFTFILLLLIAFIKMITAYDRYPVIMVLLIWLLPILSELSYKKLLLSALSAILLLVFILQPIRAGMLPFSGKMNNFAYLYQHMSSIYIGAYLQYEEDFTELQLLAESIPFAKSILGYDTAIDIIAEKGLPRHIIDLGIRHGSNTSMYLSNLWGIIILILMIFSLYILIRIFKLNFFYNTLLMMFILQGPYFIRRTFGALFIDILVSLFICLLFSLFYQLKTLQSKDSY